MEKWAKNMGTGGGEEEEGKSIGKKGMSSADGFTTERAGKRHIK